MIDWPASISTNCCCVDSRDPEEDTEEEICRGNALKRETKGVGEGNIMRVFV